MVADKSANADKAYSIGIDLAETMTGCSYTDVKLKRTDRIKSFSAANENISVHGHNVEVKSELLFVCVTCVIKDQNEIK